jgi:hypothetical protein
MPRGESFIDQRAVLENRQHRLDLPTEKELLAFIHAHDGEPGWEGLRETWEREKERGVLTFFEKETVRDIRKGDNDALEAARAFISYLDERFNSKNQKDREAQKGPTIATDKANAIRERVTSIAVISDRQLAKEIGDEFDAEVTECNVHGACEKFLRRMESFIQDCSVQLTAIGDGATRDRKKRALADKLWQLQFNARTVRNDLLREHFKNPETH